MERDIEFLRAAIALAKAGMESGNGGPFGAIVVRDDQIVGKGNNRVTSSNDPTAHAEVVAIRNACENLGTFQLNDCVIYSSCEPCPMCLGAIYWARPKRLVFASTREDAAAIGFDDDFIYKEIVLPIDQRAIETHQHTVSEATAVFQSWADKNDKIKY
ncbi:MAG: nucleoside deaminase [Flammeovirgaceae bacterium]